MKLVPFYKIAKLNKLDNPEQYEDKLLVFAAPESSTPRVESNYRVLQKKHNLEEVFSGSKKFLVVSSKEDTKAIEEDLEIIEDVEILDDADYMSLSKSQRSQEHKRYLGTCSFCGKKLTTTSSMIKSMGPVCEHKAFKLEMGTVSLDTYSKFKPLGAMPLKKGDSVVLKTTDGVGFYEYVTQQKEDLVLIDRKKLFLELSTKSPVEAVAESTVFIPVASVIGACSPMDDAPKKTGPWQQWWEEGMEE